MRRRSAAERHRRSRPHAPAAQRPPARTPAGTPPPTLQAQKDPPARPARQRPSAPPRRTSPPRGRAPAARPLRPRGRNSDTMPGRPAAAGPASSSRSDRSRGSDTPGSVARLAVGPECAAVTQGSQPGKGKRQDPVARPAAGVRDEPDAARVMLEPRFVERSGGRGAGGVASSPWPVSPEDGTAQPPSTVDGGRSAGSRGGRCDDGRRWESGARVVTLDRQPRRGRTGRAPWPRLRASPACRAGGRRP